MHVSVPREQAHHGHKTGSGVLVDEILILKRAAINGAQTRAVVVDEVPALDHEVLDDPAGYEHKLSITRVPMKLAAFVPDRKLLASAL
jgi:hypothetical protein